MEAFLEFIIAFFPASIVSFVIGFLSCWASIALYLRSKHFKRWMREEMKHSVDTETKGLRESNQRHSDAIKEMRLRLEKLETQNEQMLPKLDNIQREISEMYKILIERR